MNKLINDLTSLTESNQVKWQKIKYAENAFFCQKGKGESKETVEVWPDEIVLNRGENSYCLEINASPLIETIKKHNNKNVKKAEPLKVITAVFHYMKNC